MKKTIIALMALAGVLTLNRGGSVFYTMQSDNISEGVDLILKEIRASFS